MNSEKEKAIRALVSCCIESYASGFSDRHISEVDDDEGTINMKIHNIFIASLGADIQYYSALARSLDSSLGNMLEKLAIKIATLNYEVCQHVEGEIYKSQTDYIAEVLEEYKRHARTPSIDDYKNVLINKTDSDIINKRHESDYYLLDKENNMHYLVELKIGGDLDNKKARSEKEALLEQYCILVNSLKRDDNVKVYFATAYNRYGEGRPWRQSRVLQFFSNSELLISKDFWNMVCKSDDGYDVVIDEYVKSCHLIKEALVRIKTAYLGEDGYNK